MLKIRYKIIGRNAKKKAKRVRHGYCSVCGSKLTKQHSIDIGVGQRCARTNVMIILEMVPDEK